MKPDAHVNAKKKTATEIFDPTADITGTNNMIFDRELPHEVALGSIVVPTLPLDQRRRAAASILAAHCRDDTVQMLVSISGHVATQQAEILRARIAIGGHFEAIHHAIQKDVLSDGNVSPHRQKLALQLTYDYILTVHGYKRGNARNHIFVYQQFARNEEAIRILSFTEALLLAGTIQSEVDRSLLLGEKEESGMTQADFKTRIKEFRAQLTQANDQIEQLTTDCADSVSDLYLKTRENEELAKTNAKLEKSLEEAQKINQSIETSRAELSSRLSAARQDVERAKEQLAALESEKKSLRAELDAPRVNSPGQGAVREVEVLPQDYIAKRDALAEAEQELSQRESDVRDLESAVAARQAELARAEEDLRDSTNLLATNDALKELISSFSQFHTAYVTAQLKVASTGAPAQFREILLELDSKMEAMRLEVHAAAARSA